MTFYSLFPSQQFFPQSYFSKNAAEDQKSKAQKPHNEEQNSSAVAANSTTTRVAAASVPRNGAQQQHHSNRKSTVSYGRLSINGSEDHTPLPPASQILGADSSLEQAIHPAAEEISNVSSYPSNIPPPHHSLNQSNRNSTDSSKNTLNLIEKLESWNLNGNHTGSRLSHDSNASIESARSSLSLDESWTSFAGNTSGSSDLTANRMSSSSVTSNISDVYHHPAHSHYAGVPSPHYRASIDKRASLDSNASLDYSNTGIFHQAGGEQLLQQQQQLPYVSRSRPHSMPASSSNFQGNGSFQQQERSSSGTTASQQQQQQYMMYGNNILGNANNFDSFSLQQKQQYRHSFPHGQLYSQQQQQQQQYAAQQQSSSVQLASSKQQSIAHHGMVPLPIPPRTAQGDPSTSISANEHSQNKQANRRSVDSTSSTSSARSSVDLTPGNRIYDNTNVFVKHLPPSMNDEQLRSYFHMFGKIISCKVMVNVKTGASLGFGFIRFHDTSSAHMAIDKMNGFRIGKKKLLCKLSNKALPQQSVVEPRSNLYVKHLPVSYDNQKLRALFEPFGKIREVKVMMDKHTGLSKQIGFVRFERQVDATTALHELNNIILNAEEGNVTPLNIHYAETSTEKRMRQVQQQARLSLSQQFLANQKTTKKGSTSATGSNTDSTPVGTSSASSTTNSSVAAPAENLVPFTNSDSAQSPKKESADTASTRGKSSKRNSGKRFSSSKTSSNRNSTDASSNDQKANLFIFHLPQDVQDSELYTLFSPFGEVESVRVITDRNGQSKGFGFVKYTQFEDALQAITAMNGFKLGKKHIKVSFKQ